MTHLQNNFIWMYENLHPHTFRFVFKGPTNKSSWIFQLERGAEERGQSGTHGRMYECSTVFLLLWLKLKVTILSEKKT